MKAYIYLLRDPDTNEVRYIGKAINPELRFKRHLGQRRVHTSHVKSWIISLMNKGKKPLMETLEECTQDTSSNREIYWIKYYKNNGSNLCNHTIGGECGITSNAHIKLKESQVIKAIALVKSGVAIKQAEQQAGLSNGYLHKARTGQIEFLKHVKVPYFRNLKRLKNLD